jgi:hypothetical protein
MLKIFRLLKEFIRHKKQNEIKSLKPNPKIDYQILIINDDADDLANSLGITDDRSSEIGKICFKSYKETSCLSKTLVEISSKINHQNELVFATMIIGKLHHMSNNPILDILSSLK